jgi:glutathione S-transferase
VIAGAGVIAEYLDETRGLALGPHRLIPDSPADRADMRRLLDWFNGKFFDEVSHLWLNEMIDKRFMPADLGGGPPQPGIIRAARSNIRYHLRYIGWLTAHRNWLVGDGLTLADLVAAAHLSVIDYGGDVPWDEDENARLFYARIKSRPSFRSLLADRVAGMPPSVHYADLDF